MTLGRVDVTGAPAGGGPDGAVPVPAPGRSWEQLLLAGVDRIARGLPERAFRVGGVDPSDGFRVSMRTGPWLEISPGLATVGSLGVLLDDALSTEIWWRRPRRTHAVTTEISLDVVAGPPWPGPRLHAVPTLLAHDDTGGLASAELLDSDGRVLAVATGRGRYVPADGLPRLDRPAPPVSDPGEYASILATLRLVPYPTADGLAELRGLLGQSSRGAPLVVPPGREISNPAGSVHGGMHLCLSELAAVAMAEPGVPEQTASVRISYLRPANPREPVAYTVRTLQRGRTTSVYEVSSAGPTGRVCTVATVTCSRQPDAGPGTQVNGRARPST